MTDIAKFIIAIPKGDFRTLVKLLSEGTDIDQQMAATVLLNPLQAACVFGKLDMVEYLTMAGADINRSNRDGVTPLLYALGWDNNPPEVAGEVAKFLLKHKADIDATDLRGNSAIGYARSVTFRNTEIGKIILKMAVEKELTAEVKMAAERKMSSEKELDVAKDKDAREYDIKDSDFEFEIESTSTELDGTAPKKDSLSLS